MKLTPELLRKIIKEEMTRAENAPISLTPNQLRKISSPKPQSSPALVYSLSKMLT